MQTTNLSDKNADALDAGVLPAGADTSDEASGPMRLLVVVDQKETLVFRSEDKNSVPDRLHPYDPNGVLRYLKHTKGAEVAARAPENLVYYDAIAATLAGADEVLMMGNGTGAASAMNHLKDYLGTHHREIAERIVGTLTVDIESLTEGQLLQEARAYFQHHRSLDR